MVEPKTFLVTLVITTEEPDVTAGHIEDYFGGYFTDFFEVEEATAEEAS